MNWSELCIYVFIFVYIYGSTLSLSFPFLSVRWETAVKREGESERD